jgi:hypothetical protein
VPSLEDAAPFIVIFGAIEWITTYTLLDSD